MSSLTKNDIAKRARERITDWPEAKVGYTVPRLETIVDAALLRVALDVSKSADFAELQKSFNLTSVSGIAPFTDATMLIDSIHQVGQVTISGALALWKPSLKALTAAQALDYYHYTVLGRNVYIKTVTTGAMGSFAGTVVVYCNYVPDMTALPARYEQAVVDALVSIVLDEVRGRPSRAAAPMPDVDISGSPKIQMEAK